MPLTLAVSDDKQTCQLAPTEARALDAAGLDALIAQLALARAKMRPAHPATYEPTRSGGYACDTLLWDTAPDPSQRAIALGLCHAGLGWITLRLTRAQIEDLIASFAFSLNDLMRLGGTVPSRSAVPVTPYASVPVSLHRVANKGTDQ